MKFILLKYILLFISIVLSNQSELESIQKLSFLSCSKIINQKFQEKPSQEILSNHLLSCFIKISQEQAQKILYSEENSLSSKEIDDLIDIENLKNFSEEELKIKSDLIQKLLQETEEENLNLRKLVEDDENKDNNEVKNEDIQNDDVINDNKESPNDDVEIKDDDNDKDDDDDGDFNDMGDDPNIYGDDYGENMYDDYDDDYYRDYYDDEYWNNGNYDYGNWSDDDYSNSYGNDYGYNYNENKTYKEMIMENKWAVLFVVFLIVFITLVAIFGKDFEDTQTLDVDPNKNKNE